VKPDQNKRLNLLTVEDSDEDFEALSRIIHQMDLDFLVIHRCIDGDDALDFLHREGRYYNNKAVAFPDLVILDLNLPGTDGREVLAAIKQNQILMTIPVVVLSTSSNPKDIEVCYQLGCNSYMRKPMNNSELRSSVETLLKYWFKTVILPTEVIVQRS
jgi:CheY-like chemotaxis protein